MGAAYCDFAAKLKNIDVKKIDRGLLGFIFQQSHRLKRSASRTTTRLLDCTGQRERRGVRRGRGAGVQGIPREDRRGLRPVAHRPGSNTAITEFPTMEQTAAEDKNSPAGGGQPGKSAWWAARVTTTAPPPAAGPVPVTASGPGTDGEHEVDAKYLGVTDDGRRVRLKRKEGWQRA